MSERDYVISKAMRGFEEIEKALNPKEYLRARRAAKMFRQSPNKAMHEVADARLAARPPGPTGGTYTPQPFKLNATQGHYGNNVWRG